MKVGVIGGGGGIASSLAAAGLHVIGCATSNQAVDDGIEAIGDYAGFLEALDYPRRYVLDLRPGPIVDSVIDVAYQTMEPGDVIIDPTASYWGDTLRRYRRMRHRSLFYQDVACFAIEDQPVLVVAGDAKGLALSSDVLEQWAGTAALRPVAGAGFAHYLAMVAAARERAREALASEVAQLIEAYPGEVTASDKLAFCPPHRVQPIGRAGWVLEDAVRLEAAVPLLAQAVMQGLAESLEAHASAPPPTRGPFVYPDDIL